ncbi:LIM and calponin homology domains-containing protein 1-like isoform X4 [Palaemon carinicauda]|uniref:LIM and calponin homology domains-containing protein 1-like isoform X4 n=1 Tax=Palaemon carinicauda TaxID=392227 RepID=UPI0035B5E8C9
MPGNVRYASYGANNANAPARTKSLDCLSDKNVGDKPNEYVPARISRMAPKANEAAMQFVKTGPANLYKTATEQIKKAEAVKAMRKHLIAEEEEWQEPSSSSSKSPYDEDTDWQSNLDKWKSSRRKRNEEALERVIEIKKNEQEEEFSRTRRKSKTFSEMREDKTKRGRRYNLVVHDDDNNDLGDLGLSSAKSTSSLNDGHEENDVKDLDQDNKDAKSDAGFCTGSDTGSDGVFAEDNISDTSSALGDKKEAHDSLLDSGLTKDDEPHLNGHSSGLTVDILQANTAIISSNEYTYDKAIEDYKQYAENSAKRRTSSITSLNSNTSYTKEDERKEEKSILNNRSPSPMKSNKLEDKLNYFSREMDNQYRTSPEPRVIMREKSPKVDICKRRSMFEMNESISVQCTKEQKQVHRRSFDVSNSLRNKVASFENLEVESPRARSITPNRDTNLRSKVASFENLDVQTPKVRGITPPRDIKFHEKLATFTATESESQPVQKKTPERDINFHKKLASFTSIENGEEDKARERKTIPAGDPMLKNKIASFEQLEQAAEAPKPTPVEIPQKSRERSVSLENLDEPQVKEVNAQVFEIASKLEETPLVGSPVLKAPTLPLPIPPTQEEDSLETSNFYTDDDINEVIRDYEQVGGSYEDSSDHAENIYENITDEPMYENIYEKVNDESNSNSENEPLNEPHYQTLEEVREEVKTVAEEVKVPSPEPPASLPPAPLPPVSLPPAPLPPAPVEEPCPIIEAPEVLDVTWTDGPSQAAPPSEPPPPPPPDDDSDEDAPDQLQSLPAQEEDTAFTRENSTRRIKKEIWRRRSDFLGTSSQYIEEEPTVKPPPDLSEFLRKEREVDRALLESHQSKISNKEVLNEEEIIRREQEIIESLERSEQLQKEQQQSKYVWEDPVHQNDNGAEDMSEADENLQYQMAKNQQTPSESNMGTEVAMMVPEASPNIPESSHSVSETTDSEPKQMEFDNVECNPPTTFSSLNSTFNTEESQAEVLEKHVIESQSVEEVTMDQAFETVSQFQAETECKHSPQSSDPDHLVAYCGTLDYSSDSLASTGSLPDQYKKLAELEEEMMRHDKDMLQRAGKLTPNAPAPQSGHIPPPSLYASQEEASPNVSSEEVSFDNYPPKPTSLPLQEFYTAPTFGGSSPQSTMSVGDSAGNASSGQMIVSSPSGSPSQYSTLASPHPFNRSHSQNSIGGAPIHAPLQGIKSSPMSNQKDPAPEPLPRKKKLPPPPPTKPPASDLNTVERLEAIRLSRMPTSDLGVNSPDHPEPPGPSVSPSGQQMSKQTLLALSAIPKPRLTDNESWITKKKSDTRRDYSKHWLHQEAEQRRLEQQDRVSRYKTAVTQPQLPTSQSTHCPSPQLTSPSQTSFHPPQSTFIPQNTAPTYSSYPQSLKNPSLSQVTNSNNNNNNNNSSNSWRNQATTYQPPMPAPTPTGDKALPDSIIHNLTQRVNNKNNKNTYNNNNNSNGRLSNSYGSNYRDENYHDYMNADALSSPSSHAPLYQSGIGPGQPSPPSAQQESSSAQDQRLLSVSGKKKCSHCSEELGRGAAMIIESLRLFYHIPCFKCCVCGIQLGNGSAGADVRVRNHKLHCHNCYSNDEGMKFSKV